MSSGPPAADPNTRSAEAPQLSGLGVGRKKMAGSHAVDVVAVTDTSFTFITLPGHFDPPGSQITFTTWKDHDGYIHLEQWGKTSGKPGSGRAGAGLFENRDDLRLLVKRLFFT